MKVIKEGLDLTPVMNATCEFCYSKVELEPTDLFQHGGKGEEVPVKPKSMIASALWKCPCCDLNNRVNCDQFSPGFLLWFGYKPNVNERKE